VFTGTKHPIFDCYDSRHRDFREIYEISDYGRLPREHEKPGTDGMIHSRGSVFATDDSPEVHFPMTTGLRRPIFHAATPSDAVFHGVSDHE